MIFLNRLRKRPKKELVTLSNPVDWNFIKELEGFRTHAYLPMDKDGNVLGQSGVTIGMGFDLGQQSAGNLKDILSDHPDLFTKLYPYCGIKGVKAKNFLQAHPLSLSTEELDMVQCRIEETFYRRLEKEYEDNSDLTFSMLSPAQQTVLMSVAYQYGNLAVKCPTFWKYATKGLWKSLIGELKDFGDSYSNRRLKEAAYLEQSMKNKGN